MNETSAAVTSYGSIGRTDGGILVQRPAASTSWRRVGATAPSVPAGTPRFLHVTQQGTVLRQSGTRVAVTAKTTTLLEVPVFKLEGVLVYGNAQVTTQCLRSLMKENVWIAFFSRNGSYRGRLQPPASSGAAIRREQWLRAQDEAFVLRFAKTLVRAKIAGARLVARAYSSNYVAESLGSGQALLRAGLAAIDSSPDVESLRGVEGTAARAYFDLFRRWNRSPFEFERRVQHPARDPINVLLNIGYSLLTAELTGLVEAAGLDPAVGFYHSWAGDRPSLACDWVEEFRHPIVDRLVLRLVNRGEIKPQHFVTDDDRHGLRITQDGMRILVTAYEQTLIGRAPAEHGEGPVAVGDGGWRATFLEQLGRLVDAIHGRETYVAHDEPRTGGVPCST